MPSDEQTQCARRGVKSRLIGVVLIALGVLDSLLTLRGGLPGEKYLILIAVGAAVFAFGAMRSRRDSLRGQNMKHKILVVDDEEQVRKTIRLQLQDTGLEIVEAEDGEQGIEILDNENALIIDAIICDVRMPRINGVEAVHYFRREYPAIPVIVLTGFPDVKLATEFLKEGVDDYLVKPVEKEKLIEVVTRAVSHRNSPGGPDMVA